MSFSFYYMYLCSSCQELVKILGEVLSGAGVLRDHLHLGIGLIVEIYALGEHAAVSLGLLLAVDEDTLLALCLCRVANLLKILGERRLDSLLVAEHTVVDGDEALCDVGSAGSLVDVVGGSTAGEDRGCDLAEHSKAVALVARGKLTGAAERQDSAAGLVDDIGKNSVRFVAVVSVFINRQYYRETVSSLHVNLKLASRDNRRCRIEAEIDGVCRHCKSDGVRTKHSLLTKRWNHYSLGISH